MCDKELLKIHETRLQPVGSVAWTQANKVAGASDQGYGQDGAVG